MLVYTDYVYEYNIEIHLHAQFSIRVKSGSTWAHFQFGRKVLPAMPWVDT